MQLIVELISHSQENFYWEQYSHLIFEKYCVMLEIINQTKKLGDRENITSEEIVKFFSVKVIYLYQSDSLYSEYSITHLTMKLISSLTWLFWEYLVV